VSWQDTIGDIMERRETSADGAVDVFVLIASVFERK
jgi:hypothetical protein